MTGESGSRVGVGEIESVNPIFKGIALPFLFFRGVLEEVLEEVLGEAAGMHECGG